jgi:serine/threonine protein kinase
MKTILKIGIQTLQRIEHLHEIGYLHRDLKPENIMIGQGKKSFLFYLIDFGLVKRYICP